MCYYISNHARGKFDQSLRGGDPRKRGDPSHELVPSRDAAGEEGRREDPEGHRSEKTLSHEVPRGYILCSPPDGYYIVVSEMNMRT